MEVIMDLEINELLKLGKECFENKIYEDALKHFNAIIKKNVHFADVYNMMGLIYHEHGKFTKAQESFEKALKLNPNYTEAALNLAVTYNDIGKYKEAKDIYLKAKDSTKEPGEIDGFVKGKLANMHAEIGHVYKEMRMYDEAIEEYRKALTLRPKFIDIKTKLADTYREMGNIDKAIKEYVDAKKIDKNSSGIGINLGIAFYTSGKINKAKETWEEVLIHDQNNKKAKMYLNLIRSVGK
jgi:tetratricopeptide (TPR) repeat protein